MALFGPKYQKIDVFPLFFRKLRIGITSFLEGSLVSGFEKNDGFGFSEKLKNGPFWPNLGHFLLKRSVIYCLSFSIKFIYFA